MDDNLPKDQSQTQTTHKPVPTSVGTVQGSTPPAVSPGAKEAEKIATIREELKEVAKERREVEPGAESVEVKEIPLPEEEVAEVPPDLKELGVKPVVLPEVPEEFKPRAQVVTIPTAQSQIKIGSTQPVVASIRWWATLIIRLLQKTGGGFRYVLQKLGGKTE